MQCVRNDFLLLLFRMASASAHSRIKKLVGLCFYFSHQTPPSSTRTAERRVDKERKKERKAHEIQNEEKEGKKQSSIISFDIFQFGIFSPTQRQGKGEITIIIIVMASDRPTDRFLIHVDPHLPGWISVLYSMEQ